MDIENGKLICLPHRKSAVKDLFLAKASERSTIKYPEVYKLFEDDKSDSVSQSTWKGCVWETVEEVCREIATLNGAIYYSMLSNKNNVPEDVFWFSFFSHRKEEYEKDTGTALPQNYSFTLEQKRSIAEYERERVYRHSKRFYQKTSGRWGRIYP